MLIFRKNKCVKYVWDIFFFLEIVWDIYKLEMVSLGEVMVSGLLFICGFLFKIKDKNYN